MKTERMCPQQQKVVKLVSVDEVREQESEGQIGGVTGVTVNVAETERWGGGGGREKEW